MIDVKSSFLPILRQAAILAAITCTIYNQGVERFRNVRHCAGPINDRSIAQPSFATTKAIRRD